jgi:DNA-binding MarR family transcriptional regulator
MNATIAADPATAREALLPQAVDTLEELVAHHWRQGPGARWARRDLSIAQMHLMMVLREHGPATVGQLADTLGISPPSVSSALDRLEEHGLAVRRRDRQDRRVVHAALSSRGRAAAEEACGFRRQKVRHMLEKFDAGELEALLIVLKAVQRAAESSRG